MGEVSQRDLQEVREELKSEIDRLWEQVTQLERRTGETGNELARHSHTDAVWTHTKSCPRVPLILAVSPLAP